MRKTIFFVVCLFVAGSVFAASQPGEEQHSSSVKSSSTSRVELTFREQVRPFFTLVDQSQAWFAAWERAWERIERERIEKAPKPVSALGVCTVIKPGSCVP